VSTWKRVSDGTWSLECSKKGESFDSTLLMLKRLLVRSVRVRSWLK